MYSVRSSVALRTEVNKEDQEVSRGDRTVQIQIRRTIIRHCEHARTVVLSRSGSEIVGVEVGATRTVKRALRLVTQNRIRVEVAGTGVVATKRGTVRRTWRSVVHP